MTSFSNAGFNKYNEDEDKWGTILHVAVPVWRDPRSMTCGYPHGVVMADERHIITWCNCCLLDHTGKQQQSLPQLPHPICCAVPIHDNGVVAAVGVHIILIVSGLDVN